MSSLNAISPLEGRYHAKLEDLRPIFSEYGLIKFRVIVEIQWFRTLCEHAQIPELPKLSKRADEVLLSIIDHFSEQEAARVKHIENGINHDVKAVEYYIKEKIAENAELAALSEFIHFGCTSEDINNLAYGLMLKTARTQSILPALDEMLVILKQLAHDYADQPMLARTHGQPATPTTVGKEIANTVARLQRQIEQLVSVPLLGKLNGASGNYNALAAACPATDWQLVSKNFVAQLGLQWNPYTTQIEPHDYMAELFAVTARINTILIDFNRDMWGYISLNYFKLKKITTEVGSSTMPHKINPIDFENAEGNLGIANALLEHMAAKLPISRWQRDLSDSTVLRNVGVAFAHTVLAYQSTCKGLNKVSLDVEVVQADLEEHWEVLAEAVQMVMRRFGVAQPYETLKNFTRGKKMTPELMRQFIAELPLTEEVKQALSDLTPARYLGYAGNLAKRI